MILYHSPTIGAGTENPSIRHQSELAVIDIILMAPSESQGTDNVVSMPSGLAES
jgi:hypothetical protein